MEEKTKEENYSRLALVTLFIIGAIVGFMLKSTLKPKITSSPDDRKTTALNYTYNFQAAKNRLDKEMQDSQIQQEQQGQVPDQLNQ